MSPAVKVSRWALTALAWIGVIFFSSTSLASQWAEATYNFVSHSILRRPETQSSSHDLVHLLADKGFHVSLFCVLAILLWLALGEAQIKPWLILLCGAVVGSISELLQRFFPDRDPAVRDVLINTGGTALGIAVCLVTLAIQTRRTPPSGQ